MCCLGYDMRIVIFPPHQRLLTTRKAYNASSRIARGLFSIAAGNYKSIYIPNKTIPKSVVSVAFPLSTVTCWPE